MTERDSFVYLDRARWHPRTDIPRLGYSVPRRRRTHAIMHHTVIIDNDATPNLWENMEEVKAKMRQLQTIRPDLGLDVPYNFVGFLMADGWLIVCEGRGQDRTGAHTHGHNTEGVALALEGNFELARDIGPWVPAISRFWGWLRYECGLDNLGSISPVGGQVFGHQDFSQTACPGRQVMARIKEITFKEEDDMADEATRKQWAEAAAIFMRAAQYAAQGIPFKDLPADLKGMLRYLLAA